MFLYVRPFLSILTCAFSPVCESELHIIKFYFPSLPLFNYKVETQTAGDDAGCLRPLKSLKNVEAITNLKSLNNF